MTYHELFSGCFNGMLRNTVELIRQYSSLTADRESAQRLQRFSDAMIHTWATLSREDDWSAMDAMPKNEAIKRARGRLMMLMAELACDPMLSPMEYRCCVLHPALEALDLLGGSGLTDEIRESKIEKTGIFARLGAVLDRVAEGIVDWIEGKRGPSH